MIYHDPSKLRKVISRPSALRPSRLQRTKPIIKSIIEELPPEPEPIEEPIEERVEYEPAEPIEYEPEPIEEISAIQTPVVSQIPENKSLPLQLPLDNGNLVKVLEKFLLPVTTRKTIKRDENGLITEIVEERTFSLRG